MHGHVVVALDLGEPGALVVQHVERHRRRGVDQDLAGLAAAGFLLDRAQHVQRRALGAAHEARARAVRAGHEAALGDRRAQPLARHLHQAEMADGAHLDSRAVVAQRVLQAPLDHGVVAPGLHVDEVDDDQAGEVAQAKLAGHLVGGLDVGAQRRLLDAALAGGAAGVDVDGDQRLGLVDHQVAAGAQLHGRLQHGVEMVLDLVVREQLLRRVAPEVHLVGVRRHQRAHELARALPAGLAVDHDLLDVACVDVADGALDQARLLVHQTGRGGGQGGLADVVPGAQQVLAVALDLGLRPLRAGGAHDHRHAARDAELGGDLLQAAAVGGRGDLARHAAAAQRVRHQHGEAPGERDVGGQRRTLVAALLLDDLDQQDLPAAHHLLDLVLAQEARGASLRVAVVGVLAADGLRCRLVRGHRVGLEAGSVGVGHVPVQAPGGIGAGSAADVWLLVEGRSRIGAVGVGLDVELALHRLGRDFQCRTSGRRQVVIDRHRGAGGGQGRRVGRLGLVCRALLGPALVGPGVVVTVLVLAIGASLVGTGLLLLEGQQPLPVRDRDLVVVGVDLAEGQEAVTVAAIFDEGGLQARFDPDDLGEVDVALELLLGRRLDVVVVEPVTVQHDDAGLFRVGRVDQHALGHGTWNSGGPGQRSCRRAGQGGARADGWRSGWVGASRTRQWGAGREARPPPPTPPQTRDGTRPPAICGRCLRLWRRSSGPHASSSAGCVRRGRTQPVRVLWPEAGNSVPAATASAAASGCSADRAPRAWLRSRRRALHAEGKMPDEARFRTIRRSGGAGERGRSSHSLHS